MPNEPALRHRRRPIGACETRERFGDLAMA
jgi:hypothetical protein